MRNEQTTERTANFLVRSNTAKVLTNRPIAKPQESPKLQEQEKSKDSALIRTKEYKLPVIGVRPNSKKSKLKLPLPLNEDIKNEF